MRPAHTQPRPRVWSCHRFAGSEVLSIERRRDIATSFACTGRKDATNHATLQGTLAKHDSVPGRLGRENHRKPSGRLLPRCSKGWPTCGATSLSVGQLPVSAVVLTILIDAAFDCPLGRDCHVEVEALSGRALRHQTRGLAAPIALLDVFGVRLARRPGSHA